MAHTKGPWKAFTKNGVVAVMNANNKEIIHWSGFDASEFSDPTNEANAHLIAAAPELLEALKEAVHALKEFEDCSSYMVQFDAAITKAEGRS